MKFHYKTCEISVDLPHEIHLNLHPFSTPFHALFVVFSCIFHCFFSCVFCCFFHTFFIDKMCEISVNLPMKFIRICTHSAPPFHAFFTIFSHIFQCFFSCCFQCFFPPI